MPLQTLSGIPQARLLSSILAMASEGICIITTEGKVAFANEAYAAMLGYQAGELDGRFVTELMSPEGLRQFLSRKAKRQAGQLQECYELEYVKKNSTELISTLVSATPLLDDDGKALFSIGLFTDITALKHLQKELLANQARLELAQEMAHLGFGELDLQNGDVHFSKEMQRIMGWNHPLRPPTMEDYDSLIHPEDLPRILEARKASFSSGRTYQTEYRLVRPDGELRHLLAYVQVFRDEHGNPGRAHATVLDVTEQARARAKIEENLALLERAQSMAHLGVWEFDIASRATRMSEEMLRIFGLAASGPAPASADVLARFHPADVPGLLEKRHLAEQQGLPYTHEARLLPAGPDGPIRHIRSSVEVEKDSQGRPIRLLGITLDTTEQVRKTEMITRQQEKLVASARLSSLGEMAGGVAHEINTPLAVIRLLAGQLTELLSEEPFDRQTLLHMAQTIDRTVERISRIVQGLRTFSRNASDDPRCPVRIRAVIDDTLVLCRERFKNSGVRLLIEEALPDTEIPANPTEISQVLLNLLNNAHDAVQNLPDKWVKLQATELPECIVLQISDSGPGVPAEVREKLFQPFFTTKGVGKGTGLGLSISKGIIEQHDGTLTLDVAAENTCFVIRLPTGSAASRQLLDEDEPVQAHLAWRRQLSEYLRKPDGSLEPEKLSTDKRCSLGRWIARSAPFHRSNPAFAELESAHRAFHLCAGQIVRRANGGEDLYEEALFGSGSEFDQLSSRIVGLIRTLRPKQRG